jgi:PAS domain S-box-containing protein
VVGRSDPPHLEDAVVTSRTIAGGLPAAQDRSASGRYAMAIAAVAGATAIRAAMSPIVGPTALPFMTYFPAVIFAAWRGGLGPGIVATAAADLAAWVLFIERTGSLEAKSPGEVVGLVLFAAIGVCYSALNARLMRSQRELERALGVEAQLRAEAAGQRDRLHSLFTQAPMAIAVFEGADLVYREVNSVYEALVEGRDLVGQPLVKALPELQTSEVLPILQRVYRTGEPDEIHEQLVKLRDPRTGELQDRYFTAVIYPLRDPRGAVTGIMNLVHEVTREVLARKAVERSEAALRESERLFREIVENLPALAWSARPDGYIDFYNRRWYEYTGTTAEQMEGWGWKSVHDPATVDEVVRRWTRSIETGEPFEMEFPLRRADGRFRWFLTRVQPLRDAAGKLLRWFGTNTDIDDQRRASAELRAALETREEFLSIASHELKTPLTALQLELQAFQRAARRGAAGAALGPADIVQLRVDSSLRQVKRLASLVNALLDVSRISRGQIEIALEDVDLATIAREAAAREDVTAAAARTPVTVRAPQPVPMRGDRLRLEQVVANLLGNALKYGAGKPVEVAVERDGAHARIEVRDHGMGIAAADLGRIFERFERAVPASNFGGLGLGLYIARQIVEQHGGTISVESEVGRGAMFRVLLPIGEARP